MLLHGGQRVRRMSGSTVGERCEQCEQRWMEARRMMMTKGQVQLPDERRVVCRAYAKPWLLVENGHRAREDVACACGEVAYDRGRERESIDDSR